MVWSKWKGSLMILLAFAAMAWSQQPASPPGQCLGDNEIYLTVAEPGKASLKCRLLYCWHLDDGQQACQVQAVETGELITLLNPPLPGGVPELVQGQPSQKFVSKIFRWGSSKTPPPGFPQPPADLACQCTGTPVQQIASTESPPLAEPGPPRTPLLAGFGKVGQSGTKPPTVITPPRVVQSVGHPPMPPLQSQVQAELANAMPPPAPAIQPAPKEIHKPQPIYMGVGSKNPIPPSQPVRVPGLKPLPPSPYLGKIGTPKTAPPQGVKNNPSKGSEVWAKMVEDIQKKHKSNENPPLPPIPKNVQVEKKDPLSSPSVIMPETAKKKLDLPAQDPVSGVQPVPYSKTLKNPAPSPAIPLPPSHPSMAMQKPVSMPIQQPAIPLGAQSANAAYNNMKMPVKYLPTPMVTMPAPLNPPVPPPPEMPSPPQPVPFQNAFTAPESPKSAMNGMPNMAMGNPYMMQGHPAMMMPPPGYGMAPPMMYPQPPMMAQGFPQGQPGSPSFPVHVPRSYQGPTPPNPFGQQPIAPVAYQQPAYTGYSLPQGQYANPAMDRPSMPAAPTAAQVSPEDAVYQLLTTLKISLYPAQREWAAIHLARYDWRTQPHLIHGLLAGAKEDPAATVRVACIRSLVQLGVNRSVFSPTLESMRQDIDPRVRRAVEEALGGPAAVPSPTPDAVVPVGNTEQK